MLSIPLAFALAFAAGVILERTVIRFLYGRPLETLLATFGVSLVLQQSFRLIFTPQNRPVITPDWLAGNVALNPILGLTTPDLRFCGGAGGVLRPAGVLAAVSLRA